MPYLVVKRSDIPEGVLQVLDLSPYTSQRRKPSQSYEPTLGQTKYLRALDNDSLRTQDAGGIVTILSESKGLAAWFATNVENGAGDALTASQAAQNASDVLGLVGYGSDTAASAVNLAAINGALTTGTITADQVEEILEILAGREYVVPRGTQISAAGAFDVSPAVGAAGGPGFALGTFKHTYGTAQLRLSYHEGHLAALTKSTYEYLGSAGQAVVVYNDDGTLYTG